MHFGLSRRQTDRPGNRRFRKGMYPLPSLFTTANLAAGYYAISQTLVGSAAEPWHFDFAAIAIGIAMVADFFDGTVARLTNTSSDFGRELDSLADVVTFGVAPGMLAWIWGCRLLPLDMNGEVRQKIIQLGAVATFLFLAAGASRLARFNIQANPQPSNPGRPGRKYFVGMPIPIGAACIASIVHFQKGVPITSWWMSAVWLVFVLALSFLMVSTWRFWSAKNLDMRSRHPFRLILLLCILVAGIVYFSRYLLFFLALAYTLSGVLARLFYALRRRPAVTSPPREAPDLS
jgi:CDP-diacylglycerol---serine O-phosphatidyltransferase